MIPFVKMHGCGNDFVVVDDDHLPVAGLSVLAREMCSRKFGIGSDGLISLRSLGPSGETRMRMFNPDGSESGMCGNGLRCAARLIAGSGGLSPVVIHLGEQVLRVALREDGWAEVNMGRPDWSALASFGAGSADEEAGSLELEADGFRWAGTAVSFGNPHFVIRVDDVRAVDLDRFGPLLEIHPRFANRTNVHFVQLEGERALAMRTWERGAGATLACGSGACAAAAVAFREGWSASPADVRVPGGDLMIEEREDGFRLIGPAVEVYRGTWIG